MMISTLLAVVVLFPAAQDEDTKIRNKVESMRMSVDFDKVSLDDAMNFIREFADINIYVNPSVRDEEHQVTIKVKDLRLKSILRLMLKPRGMTAVIKNGVLIIVSLDSVKHKTYLKLYDVRELLLRIQDFPGPQVELSYQTAGVAFTVGFFSSTEDNVTSDFIIDMVQQVTGGDSWDEVDSASLALANGLLVVTQTSKVHKEIEKLLQQLRQFK